MTGDDPKWARDFDLFKLLLEEVREARRARRDLANVFTTLNLAGVGALGFLRAGENSHELPPALLGWMSVALVLTCVVWWTSNAYYTKLLAEKYKILYRFEERLGESPVKDEWEALGDRTWFRFFSLERTMPVLFAVGYVVFFAYSVSVADLAALLKSGGDALSALLQRVGL